PRAAEPAPAPPAPAAEQQVYGPEGLRPAHVLAALAARIDPDTVLVEETPSSRPDLHRLGPARRPMGFLSAAMGGLGFALGPAPPGGRAGARRARRLPAPGAVAPPPPRRRRRLLGAVQHALRHHGPAGRRPRRQTALARLLPGLALRTRPRTGLPGAHRRHRR